MVQPPAVGQLLRNASSIHVADTHLSIPIGGMALPIASDRVESSQVDGRVGCEATLPERVERDFDQAVRLKREFFVGMLPTKRQSIDCTIRTEVV